MLVGFTAKNNLSKTQKAGIVSLKKCYLKI